MTSKILLLDCSKLQSIYDVMIAVWRYEAKRQITVTQDTLTAEVLTMYKHDVSVDSTELSKYFETEYEFPVISQAAMPYFDAFCKELKTYHNHALRFKPTYHYICTHNDTLFLELE